MRSRHRARVSEVDGELGGSALLILSRVVAVDLVDLKIAKGSAQERCAYVSARGVSRHIANRVFTLGRSAILHVDQHGRPKGRVVCTENPIRIDGAMESPKLVE